MSQPELIIAAAKTLLSPFTVAELVVAAWQASPTVFGLPGFEDLYPHSKKVEATIYGCKRLVSRGLLVLVGAGKLIVGDGRKPAPKPIQTPISRAMWSSAYGHFHAGRKFTLGYTAALEFWGLPATARSAQVPSAIAVLESAILGRETEEARLVGACHDFLTARFSSRYAVPRRSSA